MITGHTDFVCNMNALTPDEREGHGRNTASLMKTLQGVQEEANGYSFHFASETRTILQIAEFIALERLCCPFFDFTLQVRAGDQSVALQIAGAAGVKDFIRSEFGEVIP
jgi:hypothetical protein